MTLTLMISTDPKAWTRLVFSSCVEGGNWMHRRYICFLMWIPLVKMEIHFQCRRDRNRSPPALSWELKQALYIRGSCRRDIENAKSEVWINKLYWNSETLPFKTLNRRAYRTSLYTAVKRLWKIIKYALLCWINEYSTHNCDQHSMSSYLVYTVLVTYITYTSSPLIVLLLSITNKILTGCDTWTKWCFRGSV